MSMVPGFNPELLSGDGRLERPDTKALDPSHATDLAISTLVAMFPGAVDRARMTSTLLEQFETVISAAGSRQNWTPSLGFQLVDQPGPDGLTFRQMVSGYDRVAPRDRVQVHEAMYGRRSADWHNRRVPKSHDRESATFSMSEEPIFAMVVSSPYEFEFAYDVQRKVLKDEIDESVGPIATGVPTPAEWLFLDAQAIVGGEQTRPSLLNLFVQYGAEPDGSVSGNCPSARVHAGIAQLTSWTAERTSRASYRLSAGPNTGYFL